MDQPGYKVANPARAQLNRENEKINSFLSLCSRLRIWSRQTGSAVPSRVSLLVSILSLNLVGKIVASRVHYSCWCLKKNQSTPRPSEHASCCLKKNQNAPRPSEHPPVMGGKMSKRLGGIKGCKYKTSSWNLNRFPDADNIGSTV